MGDQISSFFCNRKQECTMSKIQKIINIEDDVYKHVAIKRAFVANGIDHIDREQDAVDAIEKIVEAYKSGSSYDLLVTDMHFPVDGKMNNQAGMYVIEQLKKSGIEVPIVVCSSVRYKIEGIAGCIHYNESVDLAGDFRTILQDISNT